MTVELQIADYPDHENLVGELLNDGEMFASIYKEPSDADTMIEFHIAPGRPKVIMTLDAAIEALNRAKEKYAKFHD